MTTPDLRRMPENLASSVYTGTDKYSIFESWLKTNGGQFAKLEMKSYDEGDGVEKMEEASKDEKGGDEEDSEMRGVHAKEVIRTNEVCVSVPRTCLITVEMGKATPIGRIIAGANLDLDAPKHVYLMIYLLCDRLSDTSFFKPYYDILPPTLSNMPIFWGEEERGLLEGSYLVTQIEERVAAIEEDYRAIAQVAPDLARVATLDEFKWARMCVCSRNFGLVVNGVRTSALVPHADMLNHYRPRETKWTFDNESQCFTITALQDIQAGDQIYDSYGQKCNHRFLLNYGFAVEENREADGFCPNEVSVAVTLENVEGEDVGGVEGFLEGEEEMKPTPPKSDFKSVKDAFWVRDGPPRTKRIRVCVSNNDSTKSLFSMLRVLVSNESDMAAIVAAGPYMYRSCRDVRFALGLENERRALTKLGEICEELLAAYPRTIEEDEVALKSDKELTPFSNKRHAYIQVKGEKEVLHHFLQLSKSGVEAINVGSDEEFDVKVKSIQEEHGGCIGQYVKDVIASVRREERRKERLRSKAAGAYGEEGEREEGGAE